MIQSNVQAIIFLAEAVCLISLKAIYEEKQVFDVWKFIHHEKGHVRMLISQFQILNCNNDLVQKVVVWGPIMCVILINNIIGIMWDLVAYFLTKGSGLVGTTTNNNFHEFSPLGLLVVSLEIKDVFK